MTRPGNPTWVVMPLSEVVLMTMAPAVSQQPGQTGNTSDEPSWTGRRVWWLADYPGNLGAVASSGVAAYQYATDLDAPGPLAVPEQLFSQHAVQQDPVS